MVRTVLVDEKGIRKGAWSKEEDEKLRAYVQRHGHLNWRLVPKFAGLSRCGKSCRLRWVNYLRPNVRRGNFTKEEEDLIIQMHKQLGNKWSKIASKFPGRTDNDIKNHWHTKLKKCKKSSELAAASPGDQFKIVRDSSSNRNIETTNNDHNETHEQAVDRNNIEMMFDNLGITEELIEDQGCGDFWNQPFIPDTTYDNELYCFGNSTMLSLMDVGYVSWYDNSIDDLIGYI